MRQKIEVVNTTDNNGNTTGGSVRGVGIEIDWQDGPLRRGDDRVKPNGAFVEGVIEAAIQRLEFFQDGKFRCRENALAITKLEEAMMWLAERTREREERQVEGTYNE